MLLLLLEPSPQRCPRCCCLAVLHHQDSSGFAVHVRSIFIGHSPMLAVRYSLITSMTMSKRSFPFCTQGMHWHAPGAVHNMACIQTFRGRMHVIGL